MFTYIRNYTQAHKHREHNKKNIEILTQRYRERERESGSERVRKREGENKWTN